MNVLWITPSYPSEYEPIQGIFMKTQAESLVRMGAKIQIVAPIPFIPRFIGRAIKRLHYYSLMPSEYALNGVNILRPRYLGLPGQNYWRWPVLAQTLAIRKLALSPPEIVHAHFIYPQGVIALQLAHAWHVPLVITLRGGDVNVYPKINRFARHQFSRTLHEANRVLAVSTALSDAALMRSDVKADALRTGINLEPYTRLLSKEKARKKLKLPEGAFIVLYVGYFLKKKGVRELVSALKQISDPNIIGLFVGDGPLLSFVKNSTKTIVVGKKANEEIPAYLAASDLFVLPSYTEGLPNVIVEAGAAGIPVIGTCVGGIPELLVPNRGTLIAPQSVAQILQAITRIRKDYNLALEQAKALQKHIFEYYDVNKNAKTLLSIYSSLVKA